MSTFQIIAFTGVAMLCFSYTMLIGLFTIAWFRPVRTNSSGQPPTTSVTVIIAARNEEADLGTCLDAIAAQDYPQQLFEVIVVNDHSADGTVELVRRIISDHPLRKLNLLTLEAGIEGKKAAISLAMNNANGEWIITTDADCRMDKQWISTIMQCAGDVRLQMVLAPVIFGREKSIFGQLQELEFMSLMAASAGAANIGLPIMCNGANLAYRKNAFKEINSYAEDRKFASGDDMFLMMKIRKTFGSPAIRFVQSPSAIVTTPAATTLSAFVNQRIRWVSKSRGYRDSGVLITSALVYAFSLFTLISLLAWAFGYIGPIVAVTFLSVKLLVDFPLMAAYSRFANRSHLLLWYVPMQFIYLVYITLIGTFGNVFHYHWKGRKLH